MKNVAWSSLQRWECHCVIHHSLQIAKVQQQNRCDNNLANHLLRLPAIVVDGATALAIVAFKNRLIASVPKTLRNDAVEADFFFPLQEHNLKP